MTEIISGPDRFIYGVDLTGANELKVSEDTDGDGIFDLTETISLSEELKWGHADASLSSLPDGADRPLWQDVVSAMSSNQNLQNDYTVQAVTLGGMSLLNTIIQIKTNGVAHNFFDINFDFSSGMNPEWFGFEGSKSSVQSTTATGTKKITASFTSRTFWNPGTYFSDDRASKKDFDDEVELARSHDDERTAFQVQHGPRRDYRQLEYEYVPAGLVRAGKADDAGQADLAGVPTGDVGAAMWHMVESARKDRPVIVVHNEGQADLKVDPHDWELGYLTTDFRSSFQASRQGRPEKAPEVYDVGFDLQLTGDGNLGVK